MQMEHDELLIDVLKNINYTNNTIPESEANQLKLLPQNIVSPEDLMNYYQQVGAILHISTENKWEEIEEEIDIIIHKLKYIGPDQRPKTAVLDALYPVQFNNSAYLDQSVRICGGIPVDDMAQADKIILLCDEAEAFRIPDLIQQNTLLKESGAVKNNQIFIIYKNGFAQLPGRDYLSELEILAEILQPKYFIFGHEGTAWMQFELHASL